VAGPVRWNTAQGIVAQGIVAQGIVAQGIVAQGICGFAVDSLLSRERYFKKTSLRGDRRVSSRVIAERHDLTIFHVTIFHVPRVLWPVRDNTRVVVKSPRPAPVFSGKTHTLIVFLPEHSVNGFRSVCATKL
jgi:hypothetical protein